MNRDDSIKINDYVDRMISLANDLLYVANNCGDDERRIKIRDVLANVVTSLDLDILEPIYKQYPDLRPPEMVEIK